MQAELINNFKNHLLLIILEIEKKSFPQEWQYEDADSYYKEKLKDKTNINIILRKKNKGIGYLLAIPHNKAIEEINSADPLLTHDCKKYYIETISIIPEFRGQGGLNLLLNKLIEECKKRLIERISMHARVENQFSDIIQRKLNVIEVRRIERWKYYNFQEPTDYIEALIK